LKNKIIAGGLPTYVDSADAVAAATPQNWGLQGATVGWAGAAVDGSASGGCFVAQSGGGSGEGG